MSTLYAQFPKQSPASPRSPNRTTMDSLHDLFITLRDDLRFLEHRVDSIVDRVETFEDRITGLEKATFTPAASVTDDAPHSPMYAEPDAATTEDTAEKIVPWKWTWKGKAPHMDRDATLEKPAMNAEKEQGNDVAKDQQSVDPQMQRLLNTLDQKFDSYGVRLDRVFDQQLEKLDKKLSTAEPSPTTSSRGFPEIDLLKETRACGDKKTAVEKSNKPAAELSTEPVQRREKPKAHRPIPSDPSTPAHARLDTSRLIGVKFGQPSSLKSRTPSSAAKVTTSPFAKFNDSASPFDKLEKSRDSPWTASKKQSSSPWNVGNKPSSSPNTFGRESLDPSNNFTGAACTFRSHPISNSPTAMPASSPAFWPSSSSPLLTFGPPTAASPAPLSAENLKKASLRQSRLTQFYQS